MEEKDFAQWFYAPFSLATNGSGLPSSLWFYAPRFRATNGSGLPSPFCLYSGLPSSILLWRWSDPDYSDVWLAMVEI